MVDCHPLRVLLLPLQAEPQARQGHLEILDFIHPRRGRPAGLELAMLPVEVSQPQQLLLYQVGRAERVRLAALAALSLVSMAILFLLLRLVEMLLDHPDSLSFSQS
jgi:hypothetical protein